MTVDPDQLDDVLRARIAERLTERQRRRNETRALRAELAKRRRYGLEARYAAKLARTRKE